jgi:spore maturation protein CgeB
LNLTRREMVRWGYSPSVRLFEAAACGCTILSDFWPGIGSILKVGDEVLLTESGDEVIHLLEDMEEAEAQRIGRRARERVLSEHSSDRRAQQFESYVGFVSGGALRSPGQLLTANGPAGGEQQVRSPSANLAA